MKCDTWPIAVDGTTYAVDRTFSGLPAVYRPAGDGQAKHVKDGKAWPPMSLAAALAGLEADPDAVIIIARRVK